ncbi:DUF3556 domain-containing protein [Mycobacterium sp. 94-17]|uniref:DUF3556 domain-containing protein n=1 Tax=Mycobacterium sp. 94-17 TaxID=2986147 RepID=UPI002D1E7785|nr:DUF3556 domain-containing protein [Mycobacterium sp. 94-17]MEB4209727.1 DUF3556 domain-containing protein [Mycobacterium sp. 94-17]
MSFFKQVVPELDLVEWRKGSRAQRIRPITRHWAEVGFGTPVALHLFYVLKICLYILGGWLVVLTTKGIDGFTDVGTWWTEPIVFQKVVLYTMLFEVIGLGCGFGPLNNRIMPPMGSIIYWVRPGTIRLPPWPRWIPLTRGTDRTPFDVALYIALMAMLGWTIFSDGAGPVASLNTGVGLLPVWQIATILGLLAVAGLRDKVIFLAARGEVYAPLTVTFLFGGVDMIVAAKLIFLVIWLGAATSKLNHHFPFVMSTMMSNSPVVRPKALKRMFFEKFPDDMRPGRLARVFAHISTAVEMLVPLALFFSTGNWVTTIAATVMVIFHLGILSSIPMGVPLEWNVFMIFGVITLFVAHPTWGLRAITNPFPVALLFAVSAGTVVLGNLYPRKIAFLPGMRYYAGNWDTTMWCLTPSAQAKLDAGVWSVPSMPPEQLERLFGEDQAEVATYQGFAFRAMNTHGRALFTLVHRVLFDKDENDYEIVDGERLCSTVIGWNFGDGHMHGEQLINALQQRCAFDPGEVRVILLDAQPIHQQRQRYRLFDAATGEFESGYIRIADTVSRQPWDDDVPVHLDSERQRS